MVKVRGLLKRNDINLVSPSHIVNEDAKELKGGWTPAKAEAGAIRISLPTVPCESHGPTDSELISIHAMLMAPYPNGSLQTPGCGSVMDTAHSHLNLIGQDPAMAPPGLSKDCELVQRFFA